MTDEAVSRLRDRPMLEVRRDWRPPRETYRCGCGFVTDRVMAGLAHATVHGWHRGDRLRDER